MPLSFSTVLQNSKRARRSFFLVCVFFFVVLVISNVILFERDRRESLQQALERRETVAQLGATLLHETLLRFGDVASVLTAQTELQQAVEAGDWQGAIEYVRDVQKEFPYIERTFLADMDGTEQADYPVLAGAVGSNFAYRDWYKGVTQTNALYISEVYKRAAIPQVNVVAVAAPIRDAQQTMIGILVMQVRLETLMAWTHDLSFGSAAKAQFIDSRGNIVADRDTNLLGEVVNISDNPIVPQVLAGASGSQLVRSKETGEELVVAYAPVLDFGWAVIVEQPANVALLRHYYAVQGTLLLHVLVVLFGAISFGFVAYAFRRMSMFYQREQAVLHSAGDGVVAIDTEWNITLWNPIAEKITGWKAAEVVGKPMRQYLKFVRERDRSEHVLFISDAMLSKTVRTMNEKTLLIHKNGTEIPVDDSASPIVDDKGLVTGAVVVFRDTAEERHQQMIRSSFSYASHQLRTPVTQALWSTESALDTMKRGKAKDHVIVAYRAMQSVQKLVRELIDVSDIDQGQMVIKSEETKPKDVVTAVVGILKKKADQQAVSIATNTDNSLVHTDSTMVGRILYEMLDNAIEYSKARGKVIVTARVQDEELRIQVQDNGLGVPEDQQNLVFTKFFRGHNIPKESVGAGLGLFICSEYVKALKGRIWFKSEKKKGTTFYVSIPVK